jgi:hypothetical protein
VLGPEPINSRSGKSLIRADSKGGQALFRFANLKSA